MAENRRPITFAPVADADQFDSLPPDLDADEAAAFEAFRESIVGEQMGTLRVQRVPTEQLKTGVGKGSIKGSFLFSCPIDKFNFDELLTYLRDTYGTGTYRLLGIRSGLRGFAFNRIVEIERQIIAPTAGAIGNGGGTEYGAIVAQFSELIRQNNENLIRILQANSAPPPAAPSTAENMREMFSLMTMMREAMGFPSATVAPASSDLVGELERVTKIAQMIGLKPASDSDDGEANSMSVFGKLIDNFAPAIIDAVKTNQSVAAAALPRLPNPNANRKPARPPTQAELQARADSLARRQNQNQNQNQERQPEQNQPRAPAPSPVSEPAKGTEMRARALQLLPFAKVNAPTESIAASVVGALTDEQFSDMADLVERPDILNVMLSNAPECEPYRAWFSALLKDLNEEIERQSITDDAPTAEGYEREVAGAMYNEAGETDNENQ